MFPLGDASRRPRDFPIVTLLIILINSIVFLMELDGGEVFVDRWSAVPADIVAGGHWVTLLTSMFMHGGWSHIVGNMIFLWAFGPEIEDAMGPLRYLLFYLVGGLAAMALQVAGDAGSTLPALGASGAIAAVMGAFLVTYPNDRIRTLVFFGWFIRITFIPAIFLIGFWFVLQLLSFGTVGNVQTGGVAYLAHIGGAIFGAATARLIVVRQRMIDQSGDF